MLYIIIYLRPIFRTVMETNLAETISLEDFTSLCARSVVYGESRVLRELLTPNTSCSKYVRPILPKLIELSLTQRKYDITEV